VGPTLGPLSVSDRSKRYLVLLKVPRKLLTLRSLQTCQGSGVGSIPIGRSIKSSTYRIRFLRVGTQRNRTCFRGLRINSTTFRCAARFAGVRACAYTSSVNLLFAWPNESFGNRYAPKFAGGVGSDQFMCIVMLLLRFLQADRFEACSRTEKRQEQWPSALKQRAAAQYFESSQSYRRSGQAAVVGPKPHPLERQSNAAKVSQTALSADAHENLTRSLRGHKEVHIRSSPCSRPAGRAKVGWAART